MKTIIRVEHDNGIGMFTQDIFEGKNIMHVAPAASRRHADFNNPHDDGLSLIKDGKEWFCAYKSIEQFKKWILPHEAQALLDAGYKIYLLEVGEYQEGEHQIVFTKESIKVKEDMSELFK